MPSQVILEFPVDFPGKSVQDKKALRKAKESMVMELLQRREITQGKASELLGIDRHTLLDLMAERNIPMANFSPEELKMQREDDKEREKEKK